MACRELKKTKTKTAKTTTGQKFQLWASFLTIRETARLAECSFEAWNSLGPLVIPSRDKMVLEFLETDKVVPWITHILVDFRTFLPIQNLPYYFPEARTHKGREKRAMLLRLMDEREFDTPWIWALHAFSKNSRQASALRQLLDPILMTSELWTFPDHFNLDNTAPACAAEGIERMKARMLEAFPAHMRGFEAISIVHSFLGVFEHLRACNRVSGSVTMIDFMFNATTQHAYGSRVHFKSLQFYKDMLPGLNGLCALLDGPEARSCLKGGVAFSNAAVASRLAHGTLGYYRHVARSPSLQISPSRPK